MFFKALNSKSNHILSILNHFILRRYNYVGKIDNSRSARDVCRGWRNFCSSFKLWKPTISKLERGGFLVEIIAPSQREGEYYCNIDWKNPRGSAARDMLRLSIQALESNS